MASQLTDRQARLIISIAGEPGDERVGQIVAELALSKRLNDGKVDLAQLLCVSR